MLSGVALNIAALGVVANLLAGQIRGLREDVRHELGDLREDMRQMRLELRALS